MSPLWMSIEPGYDETKLMLTEGRVGAALRARLPPVPSQPRALAQLLGELDGEQARVECVVVPARADRDRLLGELGDFSAARRLLTFAATGQR